MSNQSYHKMGAHFEDKRAHRKGYICTRVSQYLCPVITGQILEAQMAHLKKSCSVKKKMPNVKHNMATLCQISKSKNINIIQVFFSFFFFILENLCKQLKKPGSYATDHQNMIGCKLKLNLIIYNEVIETRKFYDYEIYISPL